MNPPRSILSPQFKYVSSAATNLAKTFARERRRLEAEKAKQPEPIVRQIGGRR